MIRALGGVKIARIVVAILLLFKCISFELLEPQIDAVIMVLFAVFCVSIELAEQGYRPNRVHDTLLGSTR